MKTKLLKKIRRRFEIFEISELPSNANEFFIDYERRWGLPFYQLKDKNNSFLLGQIVVFRTFHDAKDEILKIVLREYSEKFRHRDGMITKVWYTN